MKKIKDEFHDYPRFIVFRDIKGVEGYETGLRATKIFTTREARS